MEAFSIFGARDSSARHSRYDRLMEFGQFGIGDGVVRHLLSSSHVLTLMSLDQVGGVPGHVHAV